jgi:hypothetical protein
MKKKLLKLAEKLNTVTNNISLNIERLNMKDNLKLLSFDDKLDLYKSVTQSCIKSMTTIQTVSKK